MLLLCFSDKPKKPDMDDLEAILKSDLSDEKAFQRAVEGVKAAQTAAENQLAAMVEAWVPSGEGTLEARLDAACEAQTQCAARCAHATELLAALEAVDAASAEARTQAKALDSPLTRVAVLAAEPFLQDVVKDALGNEVPAFVASVTAVLDGVWRAAAEPLAARAQTVAQCATVFESVVHSSCASDSLVCAQILLVQASALSHVARHIARIAAGVRGADDDAGAARAVLGDTVAALERAAAQARTQELALRQAEAHALLDGDGQGLDRTIHSDRRSAVSTAFWRLRNTLQTTVERWMAAAPHTGRALGEALCAAVAEDVVRHLLDLTVIREQECHHLYDAIQNIVGVRDECFGKAHALDGADADRGTAAAELERCWARMCALHDALEMNMAQLEKAWPEFSRVLTNEEINKFVCAAYADCPKRTQLLTAIADIPAIAVPTDFHTPLLM